MSFLEERFPAMALSYTCSCFSYRGIANNFFGKKIISIYEYVLNKVPVISSIYKGIKQVSDTLLSNSGQAFSKAVLIEFPNAGTYTFAFVTGVPNDQIAKYLKVSSLMFMSQRHQTQLLDIH